MLAPMPLHVSTIGAAMRPAWGNPYGLQMRSIGEDQVNMFMAEFGCAAHMDRALGGAPWNVGKYSVLCICMIVN